MNKRKVQIRKKIRCSSHHRRCWQQTCWGGHRWCRACWPHTPSWRLPSVRIPSEKNQDAMNGKSVWQNHFKTQQGHIIFMSEDLKRRKILLSQRRNKVASLGRWLCGLQDGVRVSPLTEKSPVSLSFHKIVIKLSKTWWYSSGMYVAWQTEMGVSPPAEKSAVLHHSMTSPQNCRQKRPKQGCHSSNMSF